MISSQEPMDADARARKTRGLSEAEAQRRLAADGLNALPNPELRNPLTIARDVLREPMLMLLLASGLLYLLLGDIKEGAILFVFAMLSVAITIVQETRTERVLEALRSLSSPRALVIRDGATRSIPGVEIVRGDVVVLGEGERVPADAQLLAAQDLLADESLLTGESVPVRKSVAASPPPSELRPGGDDLPFVFSGSLIVRGAGLAEVTATGQRSALGRIGASLGEIEREPPRLHPQTGRMVRVFALVGGAVSLLTIVLYGVTRGDWMQALLAGLAIGMSMLPEELPVVLAVFMAMGAWRISKARVLTRRAAAIETLGSATVLCTDKTGTLTENRMRLARLALASGETRNADALKEAPAPFADLVRSAALASAPNPVDPMESAFHVAAEGLGNRSHDAALVQVFGLRADCLAVTHLWRFPDRTGLAVAAKGAPEDIAALCKLDEQTRSRIRAAVRAMGEDGLRVLGVAQGVWASGELPASPQDVPLTFLGLAGLADPIRENVPEAMAECASAGIRVVMITGDHPATAGAIARQAGLAAGDVVSGDDLATMEPERLSDAVARASLFARVMPEQKLRIVEALKAMGEIVAMTGDGVNDAPSLKAAHIGVAMGGRGTDVAREASSMVLLDDDFGSIVKAIRLGRRIYDNLRKAAGFIFAVHVPIAGLALLPLAAGFPPLLGPVHIALLEMIIDPVCTLVFEAEHAEKNVMRRPPRPVDEPLFTRKLILWGLAQGSAALIAVLGVLFIAHARGMSEAEVRAASFFALVATIVGLVFVNRAFESSLRDAFARPSIALLAIVGLVPAMLAVTLLWAPAADAMKFGRLHLDDLLLVAAAALAMLLGLEQLKRLRIFGLPHSDPKTNARVTHA